MEFALHLRLGTSVIDALLQGGKVSFPCPAFNTQKIEKPLQPFDIPEIVPDKIQIFAVMIQDIAASHFFVRICFSIDPQTELGDVFFFAIRIAPNPSPPEQPRRPVIVFARERPMSSSRPKQRQKISSS